MITAFNQAILAGNNFPPQGSCIFDSSDHIRFQNGQAVSGHNYGCHRRLIIQNNIQGGEGYTVSIMNMDTGTPQMVPKQMKVIQTVPNGVEMRGFGFDQNAIAMGAPMSVASFADYDIFLMFDNGQIIQAQLNMLDRNINLLYLK